MGTLESQLVLPMAVWKQWAVKATTVLGLAGVLSFAIPVALSGGEVGVNPWYAGVIAFLATGSLCVSSVCRSALRALIISGPLMLTLAVLAQYFYIVSSRRTALLIVFACMPLMLWLGFENHRRASANRFLS